MVDIAGGTPMAARNYEVETSHGRIAVADSVGPGAVVLLIHGNSACKEVFARQFESRLVTRFRLIAFDLPGHGQSADAIDPQRSYCIPGYGDVAFELLRAIGVEHLAIFGWSLGGHAGIELLARDIDVAGLAITGTPPIAYNLADFTAGFRPMELTAKETFSEIDVASYARQATGGASTPFLEAAVRRTDGRARRIMMETATAARGVDQRQVVSTSAAPIAVITGANEPFIFNDYLTTFPYRNLWDRKVHVIPDAGHAPFWERPDAFNPLFERFLTDVLS